MAAVDGSLTDNRSLHQAWPGYRTRYVCTSSVNTLPRQASPGGMREEGNRSAAPNFPAGIRRRNRQLGLSAPFSRKKTNLVGALPIESHRSLPAKNVMPRREGSTHACTVPSRRR